MTGEKPISRSQIRMDGEKYLVLSRTRAFTASWNSTHVCHLLYPAIMRIRQTDGDFPTKLLSKVIDFSYSLLSLFFFLFILQLTS